MDLIKVKIVCLTADVVCVCVCVCVCISEVSDVSLDKVMIIKMSCMCSCFDLRSVWVCTRIYLGCSVVSVNHDMYCDFALCYNFGVLCAWWLNFIFASNLCLHFTLPSCSWNQLWMVSQLIQFFCKTISYYSLFTTCDLLDRSNICAIRVIILCSMGSPPPPKKGIIYILCNCCH